MFYIKRVKVFGLSCYYLDLLSVIPSSFCLNYLMKFVNKIGRTSSDSLRVKETLEGYR